MWRNDGFGDDDNNFLRVPLTRIVSGPCFSFLCVFQSYLFINMLALCGVWFSFVEYLFLRNFLFWIQCGLNATFNQLSFTQFKLSRYKSIVYNYTIHIHKYIIIYYRLYRLRPYASSMEKNLNRLSLWAHAHCTLLGYIQLLWTCSLNNKCYPLVCFRLIIVHIFCCK